MNLALRGLLITLLLAVPGFAVAQTTSLPGVYAPISLEAKPHNMIATNSEVELTVKSFLINLDRALIAWVVDGARAVGADNSKTFKVAVGGVGTATEVSVLVQGANGVIADAKIVLRPVEIELQWESDGYTPPLYRGRALASPGTSVITHAEARFIRTNGTRVEPRDIIYSWSLNNQKIGNISGRGKSSASIPLADMFGDAIISVDAVSSDSAFSATQSVRVPLVAPYIMLYRAHPLLGIDYRTAVAENFEFTEPEVTVAALPFFASVRSPFDKGLSYGWTVGGEQVASDTAHPFLLTLSLAASTFGKTSIGVFLTSQYHILQTAERAWSVSLSGTSSLEDSSNPFFKP